MSTDHSPLVLIAAVARNGVIGRDGQMPWHLPADARHFKQLTAGCAVIMGRRTWDSIPERFRPLPGRLNIVVTRQSGWAAAGAVAAPSLDAALAQAREHAARGQRIFVIGGVELYALALPLANELELTEIHADMPGETRFPPWERSRFHELRRESHAQAEDNPVAFDFVTYRRNS
jgi:dihydrofolate reductase